MEHYIKLFGYIQFGAILVTPLIGLLFIRDDLFGSKTTFTLTPEQQKIKCIRTLILPGFVLIANLVLMDVLQLFAKLYLSVASYFINWLFC